MFEFLRTKLKDSIFSKIFLTLLALSFGVWGVGDFIGAGGLDPAIAVKVGKTRIQTDEFQRRFTQEMERFKKSVGPEAASEEPLKRSVVNGLIQDITRTATMSAAAQAMHVVVPQENLRKAVLEEKAFQDSSGHFSQSQFINILQQNNLTERGFLDIFEDDLRQALMLKPVMANIDVPKVLSDALFKYRTETRIADTLLVKASALPAPKPATDDELKAVYTKNLATFTAPEYRKVTTVVLRAADLVKPDAIDEAEMKTYYDQNSARYKTPATRHIVQIIFDSKEKAEAARALAATGDTLQTLATKAKANLIDLGDLSADSPLAKTIAAAFVLPPNEISQPIQTELGWHLFEVTALTPETVQAFDTVKDKVRDAVAQEKAVDAMYDASVQLEDQVAAGTALSDVAKNVNAKLITVDAIDRDGKDPKGADVTDIPDRATFIKLAFATNAGADSGLKELADRKGYYVLKVDSVTAPKPKPFEEVRADVTAMYDKERRQEEAQATATKLAPQVAAAPSLQVFETPDKRVTLATLGPVSRFGEALQQGASVPSDRVSPEVLDRLFNAKTGDVFTAPVADGFVVAKVREIRTAAPTGDFAQTESQLKTSLEQSIASDLMEQLTRGLSTRYPVEVNNKVINDMVAQAR